MIKKIKSYFWCLIFLCLIPISIIALSDAARLEKDGLEDEYYRLKPIAMEIVDDLNVFLVDCQSQISSDVSFSFANDLYSVLRNQDFRGVLDVIENHVDLEGQCLTDFNNLKTKVNSDIDDFRDVTKDLINFLRREKNNLAFNDFYPFLKNNLAVALEFGKVGDNFVAILEDSRFAGLDFEEIVREEFETQMNRLDELRDLAVERAATELDDRLDLVLISLMNNGEKIDEMLRLIVVLEDVIVDLVAFHLDLQTELNQTQLKQFASNEKEALETDLKEIIINAKRKLILEMGRTALVTHLGQNNTNNLIEEVYVITTDGLIIIKDNNYVVINNLMNIPGFVESLCDLTFGTVEFTGLVGGKVATGSKFVIKDGGQVIIEYTFIVKGDLMGRGSSDISDLTRLIDHILGTNQLAGIYVIAADLNSDNNTDISDIVKIIDLILGVWGGN